jgi:Holliday junction resolvasome RuvABC DNA-binding subunit
MIELRARLELPLAAPASAAGDDRAARVEVRDALSALGYAPDEVRSVLARLPEEGGVQELLRRALKLLAVKA